MKIHMSQDTYELLKNLDVFTTDARGQIEVKGKGKMNTYWLTGRKQQPHRANTPTGGNTRYPSSITSSQPTLDSKDGLGLLIRDDHSNIFPEQQQFEPDPICSEIHNNSEKVETREGMVQQPATPIINPTDSLNPKISVVSGRQIKLTEVNVS